MCPGTHAGNWKFPRGDVLAVVQPWGRGLGDGGLPANRMEEEEDRGGRGGVPVTNDGGLR